jgi:NTE family protein
MSTAFVLAGGASLGSIEAGMVEALYEREIRADWLVGTSAGGLNASYLAGHEQSVATAHALQEVWRDVRRGDVFPFRPRTFLGGLAGRRSHLFPNDGLQRVLRRFVTFERMEDAHVPFAVVVCDLLDGEERLIESGPTLDALLATSAIPGVYPPVVAGGRPAVDGGVANNTPLRCAVERGCDEVYVLPTGVSTRLDRPPRGALAMGVHAALILLHARLREEIERYRDQARIVVLPPPWPLDVLPSDFRHADRLIAESLRLAREHLDRPAPEGAPTDEALERMTGGPT